MKKIKYLFLVFAVAVLGLAFWAQAQDTDTTAPSAITDLGVISSTKTSITLTWTAPGDDETEGTSASYDLRYSTSEINSDNWDSATQVDGEPTPQIAGSSEEMTVFGLTEDTTYYFAIKSKDEANNESELSNVASGITLKEQEPEEQEPEEPVTADINLEMNFTPQSLNLNSQGNWVTAHLFLVSSYRASDIDLDTVKLNNSLSPDEIKGINRFAKGITDQQAKRAGGSLVINFSRAEFVALVGAYRGNFEVNVTGNIAEESFIATDTIIVFANEPEQEETLITSTTSPEVYVIKNGRKRHIPSPAAFNRQGLAWGQIKNISQEEINSYEEDILLKANDSPAVYLICAGMKRHIPTAEVFESYGFNWSDISIVSREELADYPDAGFIRAAGEAKVYLLAGGKKQWIPTIAVFNKHGYKWENVIIVNAAEKDSIPEGENVQ